jgi:hypothetical protein
MPWSYARDPITGDYIKDGKGGFVKTFTAENLVRNQTKAHFAACWHDPDLGSRLYDLEPFKTSPGPLVEAELRRTLARVEATGRIANVTARAQQTRAGRVDAVTSFVDTSTGQLVTQKVPTGG